MLNQKHRSWLTIAGLALGAVLPCMASATNAAQAPGYLPAVKPDTARITGSVDNGQRTTLTRTQSALAKAAYDQGALPGSQKLQNLTLVLKRSAEKQKEFDTYLQQQVAPSSPYFHHWLTAAQIGSMFGPAQADISKITQWLQSQGLKVENVSTDGLVIRFSGNAQAVGGAFKSSIHSYQIKGESHYANASAAQIPASLGSIVQFVGLHNFMPKAQHLDVGLVSKDKKSGQWKTAATAPVASGKKAMPQFTVPGGSVDTKTTYDLAPADFNTIYNVNPLWTKGNRGAGQTIVVLERTDVNPDDITAFRTAFLPPDAQGTVTYLHPNGCADPGTNGDEGEAALDAEWAGAAAPDANVVVASCADNGSEFGAFFAGFNMVGGAGTSPGAIWSLSYGECESVSGDDTTASILWSDAAAEGVTVFVSTGDAGSVACDQNEYAATGGAQVNVMASTPYNVAVGGTDFNDVGVTSQYWTSTNLALNASAISYVPEQTWNDSCASTRLYGLLGYSDPITACNDFAGPGTNYINTGGGGGGQSSFYPQPEWQAGIYGQTNFASRTLPDVSLFSGNGLYGHALVYCMSDANQGGVACDYTNSDDVYYNSAGGTSFAAPAMAGIQALVNQASGGLSGNILPALYALGTKQYGTNGSPNTSLLNSCNSSNGASIGSTCVFNNITVGNIDEPCYAGSANCYLGTNSANSMQEFGVVYAVPGQNTTTAIAAWPATPGYSMATGLGSVNATNLANAVTAFEQTFQRSTPYVAPYDFLSSVLDNTHWFSNDGFSDIAIVDPTKGVLTTLAMRGSVVRNQATQSIAAGYTIGAVGDFMPSFHELGLQTQDLAWTGPDNKLYVWISDAIGDYYPYQVGAAFAPGWKLVGAAANQNNGGAQLLWFNAGTSQYGWWTLDGSLETGGPTMTATTGAITVAAGYVPKLADVDGDGYADLVWTNPSTTDTYVWINNQDGGYVPHRIADHAAGFTLAGAGDFAGRGQTSLVWVNTSTHQVQIWALNGFNVTAQKTYSYTAGYTLAGIADYDGDGFADLLWVGTAGDLYEWQGSATGFESFRVSLPDGTPFTVPAGASVQQGWLQGSAIGGLGTQPALDSH